MICVPEISLKYDTEIRLAISCCFTVILLGSKVPYPYFVLSAETCLLVITMEEIGILPKSNPVRFC